MRASHGRNLRARGPARREARVDWRTHPELVPAPVTPQPPAQVLTPAPRRSHAVVLVPVVAAYHPVHLPGVRDDRFIVRVSRPRRSVHRPQRAPLRHLPQHRVPPPAVAQVLHVARDEGVQVTAVREAVQGSLHVRRGHERHGLHPSLPPNLRLHREHHPAGQGQPGAAAQLGEEGGAVRPRQVSAVENHDGASRVRGVRVAGTSGGGGGVGVGGRRIVTTAAREVRSLGRCGRRKGRDAPTLRRRDGHGSRRLRRRVPR